jgi:type I restriction enzyme S subunit
MKRDISSLPSDWKYVLLGDVFSKIFSGEWGNECAPDEKGTKILRTTNFTNNGIINFENVVERVINENKIKEKQLFENDIILEKSGGGEITPVGRVVFCSSDINNNVYLCNNFTVALRVNDKLVYAKYVFYFLWFYHKNGKTEQFQMRTTGIRNLHIVDYFKRLIPLPSLDEQKRIVQIIEKKLHAVEKAKKAINTQLEITERLLDSYISIGYNTKKYKNITLDEISLINPSTKGKIPKDNFMEVSFIPMNAVEANTGNIVSAEIKPLQAVRKGYTFFENNDILFSKITPCMQNGKHTIAKDLKNGIGFGSTEFHVIKPSEYVLPEWIHYFIRQSKYLSNAKNYMQGAVGQQRLPDDFLRNTVIPLPSLKEQKKIILKLNYQKTKIAVLRKYLFDQLSYFDALSSSILYQAFRGEL